MSEPTLTPEVTWAQRSSSSDPEKNHIFLTLVVPDVPKDSMKLDIQSTGLTFTGKSTSKKCTYHVELPFYAEIDPAESKTHHTDRDLELVLRKKELKEEYWPRLLKDSKKVHFLKTDFDKWVDEDEQDATPEDDDYMSRMAGMGAGGDGGFGGIDFSKLGAGAGGMEGMGDMGMGGMGGMGGDDSDDDELPEDDDEMPALEGEGEQAGAGAAEGKGKAKIEEVE